MLPQFWSIYCYIHMISMCNSSMKCYSCHSFEVCICILSMISSMLSLKYAILWNHSFDRFMCILPVTSSISNLKYAILRYPQSWWRYIWSGFILVRCKTNSANPMRASWIMSCPSEIMLLHMKIFNNKPYPISPLKKEQHKTAYLTQVRLMMNLGGVLPT